MSMLRVTSTQHDMTYSNIKGLPLDVVNASIIVYGVIARNKKTFKTFNASDAAKADFEELTRDTEELLQRWSSCMKDLKKLKAEVGNVKENLVVLDASSRLLKHKRTRNKKLKETIAALRADKDLLTSRNTTLWQKALADMKLLQLYCPIDGPKEGKN